MHGRTRSLAWLALAALTLSCASSEQLTRRSAQLLVQGDARRAYDTALGALEKDATNDAARGALGAAGASLLSDARTRFYDLLPLDTLGAARVALDVDQVNGTLARWHAAVPADTSFATDRRHAKEAVAADFVAMAADSVHERRPRPAYRLLEEAARYDPQRRGLDERLRRTFELAVDRVAVLPFDQQIDQPPLARGLADQLATALRKRIADRSLTFTRLIEPARVDARMTVSQLDGMSRTEAIQLGRDLGANVVVWGRLRDAGSDSYTTTYREPIWHRVTDRDPEGKERERWMQVPFETVVRERVYHLRWDLRLLDTDEELTLAERGEPREVRVRSVWTNLRPDDDPGRYALMPPHEREQDPDRAKRVEKEWGDTAGRWTVPALLARARAANASSRASYRHEYRGEFERADPGMPVFCGDLPGNDDLAWIALRGIDEEFLEMIRDLDRR